MKVPQILVGCKVVRLRPTRPVLDFISLGGTGVNTLLYNSLRCSSQQRNSRSRIDTLDLRYYAKLHNQSVPGCTTRGGDLGIGYRPGDGSRAGDARPVSESAAAIDPDGVATGGVAEVEGARHGLPCRRIGARAR